MQVFVKSRRRDQIFVLCKSPFDDGGDRGRVAQTYRLLMQISDRMMAAESFGKDRHLDHQYVNLVKFCDEMRRSVSKICLSVDIVSS